MTVHIFGKNDSPCCCNYALQRSVYDQNTNDAIKECVEENFYMDDFLKSLTSEKYLLDLCVKLIEVLSNGGFRLTKWITNSSLVLNNLPMSEISSKCFDFNEDSM